MINCVKQKRDKNTHKTLISESFRIKIDMIQEWKSNQHPEMIPKRLKVWFFKLKHFFAYFVLLVCLSLYRQLYRSKGEREREREKNSSFAWVNKQFHICRNFSSQLHIIQLSLSVIQNWEKKSEKERAKNQIKNPAKAIFIYIFFLKNHWNSC